MKKIISNLALLAIGILLNNNVYSQTAGTLSFSFTTIAHSGYSGTRNVLAVWIQDNSGAFVETKFRYAGNGTSDHLPTWAVNSGGNANNCLSGLCNVVSATTGSTLSGAVTKSFTWNGTNTSGTLLPDAVYKVTIQETWNHGSSSTVTRSFSFTKGPNSDVQSPAADANFTGISLAWNPAIVVAPTANFTSTPTNIGCIGRTVQYTSTSTGAPTTYSWSFPGGTPSTSTVQNPTVTYGTTGTYNVDLTVSNTAGNNTLSQNNFITINSVPSLSGTTPTNRCGMGTVTLGASASSGTISWYSFATGGTAIGSGSNFTTPSITSSTNYYAEVSENGCASTRIPVLATVNPIPTLNTISNQTICVGSTVNAVIFSGNNANSIYDWTNTNTSIGLSNAGTGNINSFNALAVGNSTITVTPSLNGCVGTPQTFTITVQNCSAGVETATEDLIIVYPNPTSGTLNLKGDKLIRFEKIEMIDLTGKTVGIWEIDSNNFKVDLSNFKSGNYKLKLSGNGFESIQQIEIKK